MGDVVEDMRHIPEVRCGEDWVEQLALTLVLIPACSKNARPKKHRKIASTKVSLASAREVYLTDRTHFEGSRPFGKNS